VFTAYSLACLCGPQLLSLIIRQPFFSLVVTPSKVGVKAVEKFALGHKVTLLMKAGKLWSLTKKFMLFLDMFIASKNEWGILTSGYRNDFM
jgi:hypothetical protein